MDSVQPAGNAPAPVTRGLEGRNPLRPSGPVASRHKKHGKGIITVTCLLAPAVVALVLFRFAPALTAVKSSLQDRSGSWTIENYTYFFTTPAFTGMLKTTLIFNVVINPLQVFLALVLAVLLAQKVAGSKWVRLLAFAPTTLPAAVAAIVWNVAYRPSDGLINGFLELLGIPAQPWLTSSDQAMWAIIIMASWVGVGYWMMFLLAGMQDIPGELYEAAALDGAKWWRRLFSITIPLLRRQIAFVLVATTAVNFLMFAPVQIMTEGGPNGSTNLIMYSAYTQAFTFNDQSLANVHVVITVTLLLAIVGLQFYLLREKGAKK